MAEFPALPLWTDALIGDTTHLTQAEFGAYLLMLITAWRTPDCSLPNDDKYLARITRSDRNWKVIKPVVLAFWREGTDGQLRQKRLSYEALYVRNKLAGAVKAGRASALKRQERRSTSVVLMLQRNVNEASTETQPPTPTPTPTPTVEEDTLRVSSSLPHGNGHSFDIFWEAYPHKVGKRYCQNVAFPAAVKRAPLEIIIAGLERYTASKPPDRAWCNPATFLNQDRWNDQPAANQGNGHATATGPVGKLYEGAARALAERARLRTEREADSGTGDNAPVPLLDH